MASGQRICLSRGEGLVQVGGRGGGGLAVRHELLSSEISEMSPLRHEPFGARATHPSVQEALKRDASRCLSLLPPPQTLPLGT